MKKFDFSLLMVISRKLESDALKLFAQVHSSEESFESFKLQPYLTSHMTEQKTP